MNDNNRIPVIFLPGVLMPASLRYAPLLRELGDSVRALPKELEVYASEMPPERHTIEAEVEGISRAAEATGFSSFTSTVIRAVRRAPWPTSPPIPSASAVWPLTSRPPTSVQSTKRRFRTCYSDWVSYPHQSDCVTSWAGQWRRVLPCRLLHLVRRPSGWQTDPPGSTS